MKRIAGLAVFAAVLSIGATAFAAGDFTVPAEYTGGDDNKASVNAAGYSTVLIQKATGDLTTGEIVYLDQANGVFDAAAEFLLKSNPDVGKYILKLGSPSGESYETYFYVGVVSDDTDDKAMTRLQNEVEKDGKYNIGFYTTVSRENYDDFTAIKVGYADENKTVYGGFPIDGWDTVVTGEGDLNLIFQLNDVAEAYKDSVSVYLTKQELSEDKLVQNQEGGN